MSYILNIETATKNCSVVLAKSGQIIFCKELSEEGYSHAEHLHVFIKNAFEESGISIDKLDAVAVSQGPGSYTGLRIGVSTAKGLCFALDIPMIAVDTLKTLASQAKVESGYIIPMLDARRMEVYSAIFDCNYSVIRETQAEILSETSFSNFDQPIYFVGDCAEKAKTVLLKQNFNFLESIKYPSAREMAVLSFQKFLQADFVDVAYFEPFYLKDFMITTPKKL